MPEATCRYFIYRKVFPVDREHRMEERKHVKDLTIAVAFPFGDRLSRGSSSVGIFAFLPTAVVTNFPFIMQADFILTSSREAILLHIKWNLGILDYVPSCFLKALMTCIVSPLMIKFFSVPRVLEFLPLNDSPAKQLNLMRESIKLKVQSKCVVPCETLSSEEVVLCKPTDVVLNSIKFKKILSSIKDFIPANSKGSEQLYFLHTSVDNKKYDKIWNFLGVLSMEQSMEKHPDFIQTNDLVFRVPKQVYADVLFFISNYWNDRHSLPDILTGMRLFKYNSQQNGYDLELPCSIRELKKKNQRKVYYVDQVQHHTWVKKSSLVMRSPDDIFFLTDSIVTAITEHEKKGNIKEWLDWTAGVQSSSTSSYFDLLCRFLKKKKSPQLAVSVTHFAYHSTLKFPSNMNNVSCTLKSIRVVDKSGCIMTCQVALLPASKSKWAKLFGELRVEDEKDTEGYRVKIELESNCTDEDECEEDKLEEKESNWFEKYVELGEVYVKACDFAGETTPENELLNFFVQYGKAIDLQDMLPPNIHIVSWELKSDQALLLLEWIQILRGKGEQIHPSQNSSANYEIPEKFIESIKCGNWMKTYSCFSSPTCCYLIDGIKSSPLLDIGKAFGVVSAIGEGYYEGNIRLFEDEFIFIGVQFETDNMYEIILDQVKAHASSSSKMSAQLGISLLSFIRYSRNHNKLDIELLTILKEGKWLKTCQGYVSLMESVYLVSGTAEAILEITDLCIADNSYYGSQLNKFVHELKLLGVKANVGDVYGLIPNHLKLPEDLSKLGKESAILLLKCLCKLGPGDTSLREKVTSAPWIKTTLGYKCPSESLSS